MPPRKSLPAVQASTPIRVGRQKRSAPNTIEHYVRPTKRARRSEVHVEEPTPALEEETIKAEAIVNEATNTFAALDGEGGLEGEAELEAWQDFVMDHYEVVEQLPLELHRNFRLLRELDDDCMAQTGKLHDIIRRYACGRLGRRVETTLNNRDGHVPGGMEKDTEDINGEGDVRKGQDAEHVADGQSANTRQATEEMEEAVEEVEEGPARAPRPARSQSYELSTSSHMNPPAPPPVDEEVHSAEDLGAPLPDGQGGLMLPAEIETDDSVPPRRPFPESGDASGETGLSVEGKNESQPSLLPEIGSLAREIVRNCEEKLAVATGAYNAIDRHIRALDSALSAQEASILLGLRPDTNPSMAVDTSLNLAGDPNAPEAGDDEGLAIGVAGGGRPRKMKKGRKKDVVAAEPAVSLGKAGFPYIDLTGVEVDPNEPKYCFCQQASFGEMVACENDACEYEWFHLPCVGLTTAPTGKWYCLECKPRLGGGIGASGSIKARAGAAGKKRRK